MKTLQEIKKGRTNGKVLFYENRAMQNLIEINGEKGIRVEEVDYLHSNDKQVRLRLEGRRFHSTVSITDLTF